MNINKKAMLIIASVVIIVIAIIGGLGLENHQMKSALDPSAKTILYTVKEGATPIDIALELVEQKVIRSDEYLTELFIKNQGIVYTNTYEISAAQKPQEIYDILTQPTSNVTNADTILIYEGEQLMQVAEKLGVLLGINEQKILDYWNDDEVLKELIAKYQILDQDILNKNVRYSLEGYFYPATYIVEEDATLETMTSKFLTESEKRYKEYYQTQNKQGLSFHESLTLASIVERETMTDKDKYMVAQVFYNRLEKDMPLQSDITVLYAKNEHKELVTYEDLEFDSPYNTYQNSGLSPGPISSVSNKSIDAVYNPKANNDLYFFARQDTGEVLYSKTLEEHQKISEKYAWE